MASKNTILNIISANMKLMRFKLEMLQECMKYLSRIWSALEYTFMP